MDTPTFFRRGIVCSYEKVNGEDIFSYDDNK